MLTSASVLIFIQSVTGDVAAAHVASVSVLTGLLTLPAASVLQALVHVYKNQENIQAGMTLVHTRHFGWSQSREASMRLTREFLFYVLKHSAVLALEFYLKCCFQQRCAYRCRDLQGSQCSRLGTHTPAARSRPSRLCSCCLGTAGSCSHRIYTCSPGKLQETRIIYKSNCCLVVRPFEIARLTRQEFSQICDAGCFFTHQHTQVLLHPTVRCCGTCGESLPS